MGARVHGGTAESLEQARWQLDRRFDEIARAYAGRPVLEVLGALEHAVCAAGVTPLRPDLTSLARQIAGSPARG